MRFIERVVASGGLCALLFGCEDVGGLMVEKRGMTPIADARVLGRSGTEITLDFVGQPVGVTLDGSSSSDPDGHIVSYRWLALSGTQTVTDGGIDGGTVWSRPVPDGESPGWPDDVAQPTVRLGEGTYVFTLWVIDDRGNTSEPDSVTIKVKPPLDPAMVAQCVENAAEMTDPGCVECLCGVSDACRDAVSASKCDDTCWGLLGCIGTMCPDPQTQMACVPANCGEFLPPAAPMAALDGARGLGDMGANCFAPCDAACQSMPMP